MNIRRFLLACCTGASLCSAAAPASPTFVPSPRQAFDGFVAIDAPRPEVPVGALWIEGYGPTGSAATSDNIETVRSLNGVTIDKALQLSLTTGLLGLFGIEPRLRDHYSAKFTDLTVVRVKDVSRLSGPTGEPRIVEAIKAGSITVSTDGEAGLNARTLGWQSQVTDSSTTNGKTRSYAIEGRDLFIAVRVATPKLVTGDERELNVVRQSTDQATARFDDYAVVVSTAGCRASAPAACAPSSYGISKINTYPLVQPASQVPVASSGQTSVPLPVPVSDGNGGLFDTMALHWIPQCAVAKAVECRKKPVLLARLVGTRLENVESVKGNNW